MPTPAEVPTPADAPDARLFDGKTATAHPVVVTLRDHRLIVQAPDGTMLHDWPIARLARTNADVAGGEALLRHQGSPERLAIADPALVSALQTTGRHLRGAAIWRRRHWAALAAAILAGLFAIALLVNFMPSLLLPLVPRRIERGWSAGTELTLATTSGRCTGPAGQAALARLFATLSGAAGLAAPPHFAVIDTPAINAFTLPDGRVLILRGLIDHVTDPDELSGVLAHELGHVRARDPTREMLRGAALRMLASSLGWGADVGGQMTALSYSRRIEARADAAALRTLQAAGLRADGLGRFLASLAGPNIGEPPAFLSDHPSTPDRVRRLRMPGTGRTALNATDWQAVKAICDQGGDLQPGTATSRVPGTPPAAPPPAR